MGSAAMSGKMVQDRNGQWSVGRGNDSGHVFRYLINDTTKSVELTIYQRVYTALHQ